MNAMVTTCTLPWEWEGVLHMERRSEGTNAPVLMMYARSMRHACGTHTQPAAQTKAAGTCTSTRNTNATKTKVRQARRGAVTRRSNCRSVSNSLQLRTRTWVASGERCLSNHNVELRDPSYVLVPSGCRQLAAGGVRGWGTLARCLVSLRCSNTHSPRTSSFSKLGKKMRD